MAAIDLKQLVGRLNDPCRRALEAAAGMTLSRTHYNVEIEHWLLTLADRADGDIAAILRHYEIDQGRFVTDLNRALEKLKTGNSRAPSLAPDIVELGKQAWLLASLEQGATRDPLRPSAVGAAGRRDAGAARARGIRAAAEDQSRSAEARLRRDHRQQRGGGRGAGQPRSARGGRRRRADGAARDRRARPVHHRPDRAGARRARSTRSSAATTRSARSSTS